jgi:hypothetical protein
MTPHEHENVTKDVSRLSESENGPKAKKLIVATFENNVTHICVIYLAREALQRSLLENFNAFQPYTDVR